MDREEEMGGQEKHPIVLEATTQFRERQSRIFDMLDRVDEERGTHRTVAETQAMEVLQLVDTQSRIHIGPAEGAARETMTESRAGALG